MNRYKDSSNKQIVYVAKSSEEVSFTSSKEITDSSSFLRYVPICLIVMYAASIKQQQLKIAVAMVRIFTIFQW